MLSGRSEKLSQLLKQTVDSNNITSILSGINLLKEAINQSSQNTEPKQVVVPIEEWGPYEKTEYYKENWWSIQGFAKNTVGNIGVDVTNVATGGANAVIGAGNMGVRFCNWLRGAEDKISDKK